VFAIDTYVSVCIICADTDDYPVFPSTLLVRVRKNSQCLRLRYSAGYGRIAILFVYAIRADSGEKPVFTSTLFLADVYELPMFPCTVFLRYRMNRPCLRVRY